METWGGEEVSMGNSWDQEEEVEIGMWSNSQHDNRSHDQNSWNYKHKNAYKVCPRIKVKHNKVYALEVFFDRIEILTLMTGK